jgi:gamma-glutamyltranspeptidase/glutathione hydrolase
MTDGGYISLESGFDTKVKRELMKKGHVIQDVLGAFGGYQAIMRDPKTGIYYGASESRKDGQAAGY